MLAKAIPGRPSKLSAEELSWIANVVRDHNPQQFKFEFGQTPVVQATGRRLSLNMISAVSTQGEFRFMLHEGSVGAKVFVEFLKRLMVNAEKPVFLLVDGHPIHKAKMVKSYVEGLDGKLKLFYLPPYSPHLNPDETV